MRLPLRHRIFYHVIVMFLITLRYGNSELIPVGVTTNDQGGVEFELVFGPSFPPKTTSTSTKAPVTTTHFVAASRPSSHHSAPLLAATPTSVVSGTIRDSMKAGTSEGSMMALQITPASSFDPSTEAISPHPQLSVSESVTQFSTSTSPLSQSSLWTPTRQMQTVVADTIETLSTSEPMRTHESEERDISIASSELVTTQEYQTFFTDDKDSPVYIGTTIGTENEAPTDMGPIAISAADDVTSIPVVPEEATTTSDLLSLPTTATRAVTFGASTIDRLPTSMNQDTSTVVATSDMRGSMSVTLKPENLQPSVAASSTMVNETDLTATLAEELLGHTTIQDADHVSMVSKAMPTHATMTVGIQNQTSSRKIGSMMEELLSSVHNETSMAGITFTPKTETTAIVLRLTSSPVTDIAPKSSTFLSPNVVVTMASSFATVDESSAGDPSIRSEPGTPSMQKIPSTIMPEPGTTTMQQILLTTDNASYLEADSTLLRVNVTTTGLPDSAATRTMNKEMLHPDDGITSNFPTPETSMERSSTTGSEMITHVAMSLTSSTIQTGSDQTNFQGTGNMTTLSVPLKNTIGAALPQSLTTFQSSYNPPPLNEIYQPKYILSSVYQPNNYEGGPPGIVPKPVKATSYGPVYEAHSEQTDVGVLGKTDAVIVELPFRPISRRMPDKSFTTSLHHVTKHPVSHTTNNQLKHTVAKHKMTTLQPDVAREVLDSDLFTTNSVSATPFQTHMTKTPNSVGDSSTASPMSSIESTSPGTTSVATLSKSNPVRGTSMAVTAPSLFSHTMDLPSIPTTVANMGPTKTMPLTTSSETAVQTGITSMPMNISDTNYSTEFKKASTNNPGDVVSSDLVSFTTALAGSSETLPPASSAKTTKATPQTNQSSTDTSRGLQEQTTDSGIFPSQTSVPENGSSPLPTSFLQSTSSSIPVSFTPSSRMAQASKRTSPQQLLDSTTVLSSHMSGEPSISVTMPSLTRGTIELSTRPTVLTSMEPASRMSLASAAAVEDALTSTGMTPSIGGPAVSDMIMFNSESATTTPGPSEGQPARSSLSVLSIDSKSTTAETTYDFSSPVISSTPLPAATSRNGVATHVSTTWSGSSLPSSGIDSTSTTHSSGSMVTFNGQTSIMAMSTSREQSASMPGFSSEATTTPMIAQATTRLSSPINLGSPSSYGSTNTIPSHETTTMLSLATSTTFQNVEDVHSSVIFGQTTQSSLHHVPSSLPQTSPSADRNIQDSESTAPQKTSSNPPSDVSTRNPVSSKSLPVTTALAGSSETLSTAANANAMITIPDRKQSSTGSLQEEMGSGISPLQLLSSVPAVGTSSQTMSHDPLDSSFQHSTSSSIPVSLTSSSSSNMVQTSMVTAPRPHMENTPVISSLASGPTATTSSFLHSSSASQFSREAESITELHPGSSSIHGSSKLPPHTEFHTASDEVDSSTRTIVPASSETTVQDSVTTLTTGSHSTDDRTKSTKSGEKERNNDGRVQPTASVSIIGPNVQAAAGHSQDSQAINHHHPSINNGVVGSPDIFCGPDFLRIVFNTEQPFEGNIYVKNHFSKDACRVTGDAQSSLAQLELPFDSCAMQRSRSLNPRGVFVSTTVVISFHPDVLTKIDQAVRMQCFYMEADKTVATELDVSMLTTELQTLTVPMPMCRYEILDEGPNGTPIRFTEIGQQVYHKWTCDSDAENTFCMTVVSCFVTDGLGEQHELLDGDGCPVDRHLLGSLDYSANLMAGKAAHVFKYADRSNLYFSCQIRIVVKDVDVDCDRPNCQPATRRIRQVNQAAIVDRHTVLVVDVLRPFPSDNMTYRLPHTHLTVGSKVVSNDRVCASRMQTFIMASTMAAFLLLAALLVSLLCRRKRRLPAAAQALPAV